MKIRQITIIYSINKNKQLNKDYGELRDHISESDVSEDTTSEYYLVKKENLEENKTRGAITRSKAKWVEQGEKTPRYFLSLEKHNQSVKHIKSLNVDDNSEITNPRETHSSLENCYETLYTNKQSST